MSPGILLVNLGTPASPAIADVRRYLGEFLMDGRVINLPWPLRRLLVSCFILPFRPRRSAHAYEQIWDAAGPGTGSPLLHYSSALKNAVGARLDIPCELAMRYGTPAIGAAVARLEAAGVQDILLVALYPQHADSTVTTTVEAVSAAASPATTVRVLPPFYAQSDYIDAQATVIRDALPDTWDHLLLSYHGLPEQHLINADPTGAHCLRAENCCQTDSVAHATCYRHQVYRTSMLLGAALGLDTARYSVSFQSRLGRQQWLTPYTDETLRSLPARGVKHLVVACPAFVADNLETLEEIGLSGKATFLAAGGENFTLVPCLNTHPDWVEALSGWCREQSSTSAQAPG